MSTPYTHNLKLDEENVGIILDIVLSNMKYGYYFDAYKLSTTAFTPLLTLIDKSESMGHITFLPIDYLRKKLNNTTTFENEFKEKEYLYKILLNSPEILNSVKCDIYNNVPIKCLRKPILVSDIFKNDKFSNTYNQVDKVFEDTSFVPNLFKESLSNYKNAWFYNFTVDDILYRIMYMNPELRIKTLCTLILEDDINEFLMTKYIKVAFETLLIEDSFKTNIDLVLVPIIYQEHFTCIVIDLKLNIVSFYDSAGYDPDLILKVPNITYAFLNGDMSFSIYKFAEYKNLKSELSRYFYVNVLINFIKSISNINVVLFNSFKQQLSKIECGAFIISFCLHYTILAPVRKTHIKYVYNALLMKGDLMMTYLRSCFFVSMDDLKNYKLSPNEYLNNYDVYPITNDYYKEYLKLYNENLNIFNNILEQLNKSRKEFVSINAYSDIENLLNNINTK